MSQNKSNKFIFFAIAVAIVSVALMIIFTVLATRVKHLEIREVPYDFMVFDDKQVGVHGGTDALHFGGIPRGSTSKKSMIIKNHNDFDMNVYSVFNDTYGDWFSAEPDDFILGEGEEIEIVFKVRVPPDAEKANVSGHIYVYIVQE